MKNLGISISKIRKAKGLSQEELAESAKINLRTVQRIESGETEPHGNTLRNICNALDVQIEEIYDFTKEENKEYLLMMYLSVLIFIILPLGNIFLPLIFWISKKNKIKGVADHGREILNFQISWTILFYMPIILHFLAMFTSLKFQFPFIGSFWSFAILFYSIMGLVNVIFAIAGSVLAMKGRKLLPLSLPFLRK